MSLEPWERLTALEILKPRIERERERVKKIYYFLEIFDLLINSLSQAFPPPNNIITTYSIAKNKMISGLYCANLMCNSANLLFI